MQKNYIQRIPQHKAPFWKKEKPVITCLEIELTERCDNNCIHCYINKPEKDKNALGGELSTQKLKRIISEAVSLGALIVKFTGGEALLRADFKELYLYARKLGLKVILYTNGNLISQDLIELFKKTPPLMPIHVSIYGISRKCHEAITRKKGSYRKAMRGIRMLLRAKIPFIVRTLKLPQNRIEFSKLCRWIKSLPYSEPSIPEGTFLLLHCRRDIKKNILIRKLRMSPVEYVNSFIRLDNFIQDRQRLFKKNNFLFNNKIFDCGVKGHTVCLDAYGYLQPCILLREQSCVYNLKSGSLRYALTKFLPKISKRVTSNPDYLSKCARCFLRPICEQCPGQSWVEHGNLDNPVDYCCEIAHTEARLLGLLNEGEYGWSVPNWKERIKGFIKQGGRNAS